MWTSNFVLWLTFGKPETVTKEMDNTNYMAIVKLILIFKAVRMKHLHLHLMILLLHVNSYIKNFYPEIWVPKDFCISGYNRYQSFGGTCWLHLLGKNNCYPEDGDNIILRNVTYLPNYVQSHYRKHQSLIVFLQASVFWTFPNVLHLNQWELYWPEMRHTSGRWDSTNIWHLFGTIYLTVLKLLKINLNIIYELQGSLSAPLFHISQQNASNISHFPYIYSQYSAVCLDHPYNI
jgi:hypothetical protein